MKFPGALRQPLPYFLLLGAAVFGVDSWLQNRRAGISVSDEVRREVAAQLEQSSSRPPSQEELRRGLQEWTDNELLSREAAELGLDQNDSVIREHLAQKLRYIVLERTVLPEPSEAELKAELEARPARYRGPVSFDLTHVFISRSAASVSSTSIPRSS